MTVITIETVEKAQHAAQEAAVKAESAVRALAAAEAAAAAQRQERFAVWANEVIAAFDADLATAEAALTKARRHFEHTAVDKPGEAVSAYLLWARATAEHRLIYMKLQGALGRLGQQHFRGSAPPSPPSRGLPPYSEALTMAVGAEASAIMEEPQTRLSEQLTRIAEGGDGDAA
jgi:hypothetical protein